MNVPIATSGSGSSLKLCSDCKKLLARVDELRGKVSYGQFLDGLERTGVAKDKILRFLQADPDGKGSVQDQVTAEMTSELMKVMGIGPRNGARGKTYSRRCQQRIRLTVLCLMAITVYLSLVFLALYLVALAVHRYYFLRDRRRMAEESREGARVIAKVDELAPGSVKKFWLICRSIVWMDF